MQLHAQGIKSDGQAFRMGNLAVRHFSEGYSSDR